MTLTRPPHDPELGAALDVLLENLPPGDMTMETVIAMRDESGSPLPAIEPEALESMGIVRTDLVIPVSDGGEAKATILKRADHTDTGPGIYYVHGGGMVSGHRLLGVDVCLPWIVDHDAVVLTVDYRLAPEFPDPYPVEDAYAGLVWMAEHADDFGVDPASILIAGASAGGGIAAGTALLARDRQGPALIGQLLVCPMLDDRDRTVSSAQVTEGTTWSRGSNRFGWSNLLGDRVGTDDVSIYAAPARAEDLTGLPPTFIDCGAAEVFRDEDVAYAAKLWEAGVDAELHVWAGGFHGFDMLAPYAAVSRAAIAARDSWVERVIGQR